MDEQPIPYDDDASTALDRENERKEQLEAVFQFPYKDWMTEPVLTFLATYLDDTIQWPLIKGRWQELWQRPQDLEKAVKGIRKKQLGTKQAKGSTKRTASLPPVFQNGLPPVDPASSLDSVSPCTHVANAKRIASHYTDSLHYVLGLGWILWTGKYWRPDPTQDSSLAVCFASGLAKIIADEVAALSTAAAVETDKEHRELLMELATDRLKWAIASESARVVSAGLQLAKADLLLDRRATDTDPWLFNCQNGTIDLRTGKPQPHNPADLLTHITPVTYDEDATCPQWEAFLLAVFAGDTDMVAFMQRALGYSLVGLVRDRVLFLLYGPTGWNGKTTIVETYAAMLGLCDDTLSGYARKVDINTFAKSRNVEENQRKVVVLDGARFVYTSEVADGQRLNEQLIKDITGRDTLDGRRLYRESFNFSVQFKPWMYGNYKPDIRGTDDAIWDRVKMIEFEVSFKDSQQLDLKLPEKLLGELPGILNWCIKGCLDWQASGLNPPETFRYHRRNFIR